MSLNPIDALLDVGKMAINRIWPDPIKQAEEERKLLEMSQKGGLAEMQGHIKLLLGQMEINKIEADNKSIFVAGWRPFTGWVCATALAYVAILEPLMRFAAIMYGYKGGFPVIDTTLTMQVLIGMLGLGVMRTNEKQKGVHKDSLK